MSDPTPAPSAALVDEAAEMLGCKEAVHRGQALGWCAIHKSPLGSLCLPCPVAVDLAAKIAARDARRDAQTRADEWEIGQLKAERDALAAQVARVEGVLDHWRTVDEGNAAYAERIGERSRFADGLASRADMLRAALAGSEADTSDVDVCSGDADCTSELHVHGCFADAVGPCTDPDEHQPTGQEDMP